MSIILAGFAEIEIDPPVGCELTGYAAADRTATGTHDPLKAFAVVLDDRRQKSVLCSVDLCVIHADVTRVVKKRVSGRTAIPEERIIIAATHTHSAPKLMNSDLLVNQRWVRELEDHLTQVMMLADYHRVPATVAAAVREVEGIGGNRRAAGGPVDSGVSVLRVDGVREGRPLGAIVNVACHPTVLGPDNREYTADFIGAMRETMQSRHGGDLPVICFNGACGDVNPGGYSAEAALRGETVPDRTFERAQEIGDALGRAAHDAFAHAENQPDPQVEAEARTFAVTLRPFPLPAEAREAYEAGLQRLEEAPAGSEAEKEAKADVAYARQRIDNAKIHAACPDGKMNVTLQAFSVSGWSLVAFPTEVFAAHGLALKERSPFAQTMIAAYANQSLGYLPDYSADDADSYEQRVALFGGWAVDTIVGHAHAMLAELWKRQQNQNAAAAAPAPDMQVKPELVLEETPVERACVPAIDFHLHWWTYWHSFEEVLERMDKANIQYGVTLVGDVFPKADLRPVLKLMEPVKGRFFYFTAVDFSRIDDPDWPAYVRDKLRQDVELGARGIKLYKDLGLGYHDSRGNLLRAMDPRVRVLWEVAAEMGLPVLYHVADPPAFFEPVEPSNERYDQLRSKPSWWWGRPGFPSYDELIDEMYELAAAHRETTFVFPHCASLSNDLRRCSDLISSGDNIYVDLSARLPQLARQPCRAHDFCVKHADRILFGTDDSLPGRNNVYPLWFRLLETKDEYFGGDYYGVRSPWRFYGMGLPRDVLTKIYRTNAMRLLNLEDGGSGRG